MVTSSMSSSSSASFSSFDEVTIKTCSTVKFLCSYGGRILPRYPDGRLRYVGGETRVLAVDRSISFSELQMKMGKLCGWEVVNLRCQLPTEDLDALVSVSSDEDLANIMEEYDLASRDRQCPIKIRAFLHQTPGKSPKSASPPATPFSFGVPRGQASLRHPGSVDRLVHQCDSPARYSYRLVKSGYDFRFHRHPANGCPAAARHLLAPTAAIGNNH